MLMDANSRFSGTVGADGVRTAQAIAATAISSNVIDLRNATSPALADEGHNEKGIWLVVQAIQGFNTLTSLTVTLESDSAPGMATAPVVHFSKTIALAGLTAGANLARVLLPSDDYKRYLGVRYTVTGANPTLGSVFAFITEDTQRNIQYPSGLSFV